MYTKDEILTILNAARMLHKDAADAHHLRMDDSIEKSNAAHQATVHFAEQVDSSYTPDLLKWSIAAKLSAAAHPNSASVPAKHRKVARELVRINAMLRTDLA
jgi:hypothetical protein